MNKGTILFLVIEGALVLLMIVETVRFLIRKAERKGYQKGSNDRFKKLQEIYGDDFLNDLTKR